MDTTTVVTRNYVPARVRHAGRFCALCFIERSAQERALDTDGTGCCTDCLTGSGHQQTG
jgi:hypothetical protein